MSSGKIVMILKYTVWPNSSLRYPEFVVPLVKAVQELMEEKKHLELRLEALESRMNELVERIPENK